MDLYVQPHSALTVWRYLSIHELKFANQQLSGCDRHTRLIRERKGDNYVIYLIFSKLSHNSAALASCVNVALTSLIVGHGAVAHWWGRGECVRVGCAYSAVPRKSAR